MHETEAVRAGMRGIARRVARRPANSACMFADCDRDLLLLGLADDRQRGAAVLARGADEDSKLPNIHDLLIVVELQDIEPLQARRGRRAVRQHRFHDQPEILRQA